MDRKTHQEILAQMYGCEKGELLNQYERMTPQIRQSAIVTLAFEKVVTTQRETVNA